MQNEGIIFMGGTEGGGGDGIRRPGPEPTAGGTSGGKETTPNQGETGKPKAEDKTAAGGRMQDPRQEEGDGGSDGEGKKKKNMLSRKDVQETIEAFANIDDETRQKLAESTIRFYKVDNKDEKEDVTALSIVEGVAEGLKQQYNGEDIDPDKWESIKRLGVLLKDRSEGRADHKESSELRDLINKNVLEEGLKRVSATGDIGKERVENISEWLQNLAVKGDDGKMVSIDLQKQVDEFGKKLGLDLDDNAKKSIQDLIRSAYLQEGEENTEAAAPAPPGQQPQQSEGSEGGQQNADGSPAGGEGAAEGSAQDGTPDATQRGEATGGDKKKKTSKMNERLKYIMDKLNDPEWWKKTGMDIGKKGLILLMVYLAVQLAFIYMEAEAIEKVTTGH